MQSRDWVRFFVGGSVKSKFGQNRHYSDSGNSTIKFALIFGIGLLLFSTTALVILLTSSLDNQAVLSKSVVVERESSFELIDVLVPIQEIPSGSLLEPAMFKIDSRPKVGVSGLVIKDFEEIKGKYAKTLIIPGQILNSEYISLSRPVNAITASIPEGFRAVTIQVDVKTGIEGWARAGARVDVTWISSLRGQQAVTVIVENAKIISAARRTEDNNKGPDVLPTELTLLVPIEDARRILLAQQSGSLSLSLRGDNDSGKSDAGRTFTVDDLIGGHNMIIEKRDEAIVKIRDANGTIEEFALRNGKLIPLSEVGIGGNSHLSIGSNG